jgi:uncharacterized protein (DUF362 family)
MVVVALVNGSRELATVHKVIDLAGGIKDIAEKYSRALMKVNFITTRAQRKSGQNWRQ